MSSSAVQFYGIEQVIRAYENNDVPTWAIVAGKDILFQYVGDDIEEGSQKLYQILEMLKAGDSAATYQLKVYAEPKGRYLNSKDDFNFSFKFKLETIEESVGYAGLRGVKLEVLERLKALEEKNNIQPEEEEEEPQSFLSGITNQLMGALQNPEVQKMIMVKVAGFVSSLFNRAPAAVAGVQTRPMDETKTTKELYDEMAPDQKAKFDEGIAILLQVDPLIGERLYKLALMARDNPQMYAVAAGMLK